MKTGSESARWMSVYGTELSLAARAARTGLPSINSPVSSITDRPGPQKSSIYIRCANLRRTSRVIPTYFKKPLMLLESPWADFRRRQTVIGSGYIGHGWETHPQSRPVLHHPRRAAQRSIGLIDTADNFAVRKHVEIIVVPLAGWPGPV